MDTHRGHQTMDRSRVRGNDSTIHSPSPHVSERSDDEITRSWTRWTVCGPASYNVKSSVSKVLGGRPIGRTPDSGSGYPGSSPGLPANLFNELAKAPPSNLRTLGNRMRLLPRRACGARGLFAR